MSIDSEINHSTSESHIFEKLVKWFNSLKNNINIVNQLKDRNLFTTRTAKVIEDFVF